MASKKELQFNDLAIDETRDLPPAPPSLTAEQVREDIEFLTYALRNGYGGRDFLPGSTFEDAIRAIQRIDGAMTPIELKDRVDSIFLHVPDNHLKARLDGKPSPGRKVLGKSSPVGSNAASPNRDTWDVRLERKATSKGRKQVLYVSVRSWLPAPSEKWSGFLDQVRTKISKSDLAVLDFRGNTGGDDTTGAALASIFYGRDFTNPIARQHKSQTPETIVIATNLFRLMKIEELRERGAASDWLDQNIARFNSQLDLARGGALPAYAVREFPAPVMGPIEGYSKPIFILMDSECASSCESSIDFFESHPNVKRVGLNTAGYVHFGNTGYVILPNSRIDVQVPTHYNEYRDKRFIEKTGIKPDMPVPIGIDAYQFVLNHL